MNKTNFHLLITLNICLPCIVENLEAFWFINTVDGSKTRYVSSSLHRSLLKNAIWMLLPELATLHTVRQQQTLRFDLEIPNEKMEIKKS